MAKNFFIELLQAKANFLQFVECAVPSFGVPLARLLAAQHRVGEDELGATVQRRANRSRSATRRPRLHPPSQRQVIASRSGGLTSRYSPLLSCSVPSSMRKRTLKRPPTRTSVLGEQHRAGIGAPPMRRCLRAWSALQTRSKGAPRCGERESGWSSAFLAWRLSCLRFFFFGVRDEPVQAAGPELLVSMQPCHSLCHRLR